MSLTASEVDRAVLPFNPPGTFPPGTFPPGTGTFIHGEAPLRTPSYPIRAPEPSYSPTPNAPPPPAYTSKPLPAISPNLSVEPWNDKLFEKLMESESLVRTHPDAASLHAEAVQSTLATLTRQETEAEGVGTKIVLRDLAERYKTEMLLSPHRLLTDPPPGPLTGMLRILCRAEAEEGNESLRLVIAGFAEGFREAQAEGLRMDSGEVEATAAPGPFHDIDVQTQSDSLFQELWREEARLVETPWGDESYEMAEKHAHTTLAKLDAELGDLGSKIAIVEITNRYKERMESSQPRPGPWTTMLLILARAEATEKNVVAKRQMGIIADRIKSGYRAMCRGSTTRYIERASAQAIHQAPLPMQPAVVAQPRHVSIPAGYIGADPLHGALQLPVPPSPSWSTGSTTVADSPNKSYTQSLYSPSLQSPSIQSKIQAQRASYFPQLAPSPSPAALEDTSRENLGGSVPSLSRQPKAKYISGGTITSKDPLLNTDGDALYRYILDNMGPPTFRLHCYGSHTETDIRARGNKVETVERTIVDFDFVIDLANSIRLEQGDLYVLDDNTRAYRGGMEMETFRQGMPRTVHEWAKDYGNSPKQGKEFRFRKAVIGLERNKTIDAVNQIINSTGHSTHRKVYFSTTHAAIKVRVDSPLMAMLKGDCVSCLLWLVLVYPIIWLVRRFGQEGGKWDVCRAAYVCDRDPRDPSGSANGVPLGDGDWMKIWERTLRLAVGNRIQSSSPIYRPTANDSGVILFD